MKMSPENLSSLTIEIIAEFGCSHEMGEAIARYMDGEDNDDTYEYLYDRLSEKMPYGTAKARDGDPYNWISDYMVDLFGTSIL